MSPPDEQGQGEGPPQLEEEEPAFPHTDLAKLDDMINRYLLVCQLWFSGVGPPLSCSALLQMKNALLLLSYVKYLSFYALLLLIQCAICIF